VSTRRDPERIEHEVNKSDPLMEDTEMTRHLTIVAIAALIVGILGINTARSGADDPRIETFTGSVASVHPGGNGPVSAFGCQNGANIKNFVINDPALQKKYSRFIRIAFRTRNPVKIFFKRVGNECVFVKMEGTRPRNN